MFPGGGGKRPVALCWVYGLLGLVVGLALSHDAGAEPTRTEPATVKLSPDGTALWFDGLIDDDSVSTVEHLLQQDPVTTLYIRSAGGSAVAGIRLGERVRDAGLTVNVQSYCLSSCANYVFTAGKTRIINGVVAWHGGVEQKDFREAYLCGRSVSSLYGHDMGTIPAERRESVVEEWRAIRDHERQFFDSIGVNPYITRAGQEPVLHPGDHTYSVADMQRLGLISITAPDGYGTSSWCEQYIPKTGLSVACIVVTDEMLDYERSRMTLGEECQSDGTLKVRSAAP